MTDPNDSLATPNPPKLPDQPASPPPPPTPKCGARSVKHTYLFVPQDDITARELASATEMIMFGFAGMIGAAPPQAVDQLYAAMGDGAKRHWQTHELPQQPPIAVAKYAPSLSVGQQIMQAQRMSRRNGRSGGGLHLPPGN